jgi:hypothetical protein
MRPVPVIVKRDTRRSRIQNASGRDGAQVRRARLERPTEAPLGRTRYLRCIGTTCARASCRSVAAPARRCRNEARAALAVPGGSGVLSASPRHRSSARRAPPIRPGWRGARSTTTEIRRQPAKASRPRARRRDRAPDPSSDLAVRRMRRIAPNVQASRGPRGAVGPRSELEPSFG